MVLRTCLAAPSTEITLALTQYKKLTQHTKGGMHLSTVATMEHTLHQASVLLTFGRRETFKTMHKMVAKCGFILVNYSLFANALHIIM